MILKIRKSLFETNSSSVHTIGITKRSPPVLPSEVFFEVGEFGWYKDLADTKNYLYTAILYMYKYETEYYEDGEKYKKITQKRLDKLRNILIKHGINPIFVKPRSDEYYIDHVEQLNSFIDMVLDNEDVLIRFLFGYDSYVETGNDNDSYQECIRDIDSKNFDYFWKGN